MANLSGDSDFSTLVDYVKGALNATTVGVEGEVQRFIEIKARNLLAQEHFEKLVQVEKERLIQELEKPFEWFPWKITFKVERR